MGRKIVRQVGSLCLTYYVDGKGIIGLTERGAGKERKEGRLCASAVQTIFR